MHYRSHTTLRDRFREAGTKVEDGKVTNLPDLSTDHGTYVVETVRETKNLKDDKLQTVYFTHADENSWLNFSLDYDPATGEWDLCLSLADKLNDLVVQPTCDGGRVSLGDGEGNSLTQEQLDYLGLAPDSDGTFGSVEAHPEGSDRGGYVPTLDAGPYFDEGGGEWQG